MPLYTCDVQKRIADEFWTNRYVLQAADFGEAQVLADLIPGAEQKFHTTNVYFDRYRVRPLLPGGDIYKIVTLGPPGLYVGGAASTQLPLFNVVRVDLRVAIGRPSRKYYRTGLTEGMVEGPILNEAYRSVVETSLDELRVALGVGFVDNDAQAIVDNTVFAQIGMRQLRRGTRRRTTPVIQ